MDGGMGPRPTEIDIPSKQKSGTKYIFNGIIKKIQVNKKCFGDYFQLCDKFITRRKTPKSTPLSLMKLAYYICSQNMFLQKIQTTFFWLLKQVVSMSVT